MLSKTRGINSRCDTRRATDIANIALYWLALVLGGYVTKQNKVKTNAMRLLDNHHIAYKTFTYPDTVHSANEVAPLLGVSADLVFKTLVVLADKGRQLLILVPGNRELDLRMVAHSVGAKDARMAPQREAERLTGLKVGGISPLALLDKHFEIYLDASGEKFDELYINGGQRGINVRLRTDDLLTVTKARVINATSAQSNQNITDYRNE
jgi:Cys-tRNA(Pro)/Cys-tRNA(Cys) deacylase